MGLTQIALPPQINHGGVVGPVCLIIPPSVFLLDERVFMTLGILKVAAVLEREGISVEVLDLSGVKNFTEVVSDYLVTRPLVKTFGLTATTPQLPAVRKIVEILRSGSKVKIILGGPHITLMNAAYKREIKNGVFGRAAEAMLQAEEEQ